MDRTSPVPVPRQKWNPSLLDATFSSFRNTWDEAPPFSRPLLIFLIIILLCFQQPGSIWSPPPGRTFGDITVREKKKATDSKWLHFIEACEDSIYIYIGDTMTFYENGVITDFCIMVVIYLHISSGWVDFKRRVRISLSMTPFTWTWVSVCSAF